MRLHPSIVATVGAAFALLLLTGCGKKEALVLEPETVEPTQETAGIIDDFRNLTGYDLMTIAHDPGVLGFPGDADDPRLSESSQLLILEPGTEAADSQPTGLERYGRFVINAVNSDEARDDILLSNDAGEALIRDPSSGIFWERVIVDGPEDSGTIEHWLAHKPYEDVVSTWLSSERATDTRWAELDQALSEMPPDEKSDLPSGQKGTAPSGNGAGR